MLKCFLSSAWIVFAKGLWSIFKFMILILSKELDLSYFNYEETTLLHTILP